MKAKVDAAKASDVKHQAGRLTALAPDLERIEAIDERLAGIRADLKDTAGLLAPGDLGEALAAYLRQRRESFERPGPRATVWDLLQRLSAGKAPSFQVLAPDQLVLDLLLFLLGERVEELATEAICRLPIRPGMSAKERERVRAKLDAERVELVAERERLVEKCRNGGLTLAHLVETQQRLNAETRAREQEARQRDRQRRVERDLDGREAGA